MKIFMNLQIWSVNDQHLPTHSFGVLLRETPHFLGWWVSTTFLLGRGGRCLNVAKTCAASRCTWDLEMRQETVQQKWTSNKKKGWNCQLISTKWNFLSVFPPFFKSEMNVGTFLEPCDSIRPVKQDFKTWGRWDRDFSMQSFWERLSHNTPSRAAREKCGQLRVFFGGSSGSRFWFFGGSGWTLGVGVVVLDVVLGLGGLKQFVDRMELCRWHT